MTIAGTPQAPEAIEPSPVEAWSQRVRKVGGYIQLGFAAFWLVRGGLSIGDTAGIAVAAAGLAASIGVLVYAIRVAAGTGPRPTGPEAERIERSVTLATVIELVASFAFPFIVIAHHHRRRSELSVAGGRFGGQFAFGRARLGGRRSHDLDGQATALQRWGRLRRCPPDGHPVTQNRRLEGVPPETASLTGEEPTLRSASTVGAATLASLNVLRIR